MNTTLNRAAIRCLVIVAASGAAAVHAQTVTPPLTSFVNDPATNASGLQQQTGVAVQRMCGALGLDGGFRLTGAKQDLFLRCNEMVETARTLQGGVSVVGRSLGYTNRSDLLATIQQASGEEIAAQGTLSTQVSAGQFANIGGRLTALRLGGASAAAHSRVAQLDGALSPSELLAQGFDIDQRLQLGGGAAADAQASDPIESRFGWFVESSYGFGDHDQTANEDQFDFDSVSVTTGTDYNFGSSVLGVSVGYDRYTADFDSALLVSGGDVEVEGMSGSLFGGYFGAGWTLNGIATYGSLQSDVTRRVVYASNNAACALGCGANRTLTGDPDGSYVALGVTVGYEFTAGGWDIAPSLSANYRDVDIDGYDETDTSNGGLALRYEEQSIKSTRSILSLGFARPISRSFGVLMPTLRLEWHHEFEDDPRSVRAKYVLEDTLTTGASSAQDFACSISCFTMLSDPVDADFGVAALGLSTTFAQRMQFYLIYEALLGTANLSSNSIALGLRGQF
jgi:outer membrane lipase/esterase